MEPSKEEMEQAVRELASAVQDYEQELRDIDKRYDIKALIASGLSDMYG